MPETLLVERALFFFFSQNLMVFKPGVEIPFILQETAKQRGEQIQCASGRGEKGKGVELCCLFLRLFIRHPFNRYVLGPTVCQQIELGAYCDKT